MNDRLKKFTVGLVMLSMAGGAAGYGCPAVVDSIWRAGMLAMSATISLGIASLVETVTSARIANTMRIQSAIRVVVKQIDSSAEKLAATEVASKQAGASFMVELANREAILETMMDYNAATGQGFDPCGEQLRSQDIAAAMGEANTGMSERVLREIDAAPGRLVASPASVVAQRMSEAKSSYCTPDQAAMGYCSSPGAMAGKDADAAHFFTTHALGTPEAQAKNALINNMYGLPYAAPPRETLNSPAGKAFLEAKQREDAFRSVSQASLKSIQSWTESRPGSGGQSNSVLGAISAKVGTYSGGSSYPVWETKLAAMSERGLLVDMAKMRALDMFMRHLEYQQYERMEANLAALVAARATSIETGAATTAAARARVN